MIDPMATGTVKRPSADLRRPRGREALSPHPPTPVDDTTYLAILALSENSSYDTIRFDTPIMASRILFMLYAFMLFCETADSRCQHL